MSVAAQNTILRASCNVSGGTKHEDKKCNEILKLRAQAQCYRNIEQIKGYTDERNVLAQGLLVKNEMNIGVPSGCKSLGN
jgi:hypothetical protein